MVMHSHEVKEGIGFGLEALTYHLIDAPNLRCKQTIYYAFTLLRIFFFLYISRCGVFSSSFIRYMV